MLLIFTVDIHPDAYTYEGQGNYYEGLCVKNIAPEGIVMTSTLANNNFFGENGPTNSGKFGFCNNNRVIMDG